MPKNLSEFIESQMKFINDEIDGQYVKEHLMTLLERCAKATVEAVRTENVGNHVCDDFCDIVCIHKYFDRKSKTWLDEK